MKKMMLVLLVLTALVLAGCSTTVPVCATSNPVGSKVGEATGVYIMGYVPLGNIDVSIKKAAQNGNIKEISTVDQKVYTGLFLTTVTTIVTGE